jgi:hypothetical protein
MSHKWDANLVRADESRYVSHQLGCEAILTHLRDSLDDTRASARSRARFRFRLDAVVSSTPARLLLTDDQRACAAGRLVARASRPHPSKSNGAGLTTPIHATVTPATGTVTATAAGRLLVHARTSATRPARPPWGRARSSSLNAKGSGSRAVRSDDRRYRWHRTTRVAASSPSGRACRGSRPHETAGLRQPAHAERRGDLVLADAREVERVAASLRAASAPTRGRGSCRGLRSGQLRERGDRGPWRRTVRTRRARARCAQPSADRCALGRRHGRGRTRPLVSLHSRCSRFSPRPGVSQLRRPATR